jgi:general stress protein 26
MVTRKQELAHLSELMEKIDIAMLTTIGAGGYLVSRPLSTQAATFDGERVWFFSEADSPKVAELRRHAKVNVSYSSKDANTYISAAGDARIVRERALIDRFWNDALKAFFPEGPDDPNLVLIEVRLRTVEYWDGPGSWLGKAATFIAARITGNDDVMAENRIVEVASGRSHKPPGADRPGRSARKKTAPAKAERAPTKRTGKAAASTAGKTSARKRGGTATEAAGRGTRKSER